MFTKELQSIVNMTVSGFTIGLALGGMSATKNTVNNFIMNNEATRFISHFDAKRSLQHSIVVNFLKKGARLGTKLGIFCFIFRYIYFYNLKFIYIENYKFFFIVL